MEIAAMMRLLSAPASPFVRKVAITARVKGIIDQISIEHADTRGPNPVLQAANPLSKIPALVLADGTQIFDSRVICEYLDSLTPSPVLFQPSGIERYRMLTQAALADGIMEAALLMVYEQRYRPADKWVPDWIAKQQRKVDAGLAVLEAKPPDWTGHPDYSHIAVACALGYLDLRFDRSWRASHPGLVAWLDRFADTVPGFHETQPVG
jgi:glutathione S-transferase